MSTSPVTPHRMAYWAAIAAGTAAIVAGGWSATQTLGAARHPIARAVVTSGTAPAAQGASVAPRASVSSGAAATPRASWGGDDGHSGSGDG